MRLMSMDKSTKKAIVESVAKADVGPKHLEKARPMEAVQVLEMLADGKSYRQIQKATGVGLDGVARLKARHGAVLEERRKELAKDGFEVMEKARQLLNRKLDDAADDDEKFDKLKPMELTTIYAIAQDKAFAAEDGNKVVVEHVKKGVSVEEAMKAIQEAQKRVKGEAIDV